VVYTKQEKLIKTSTSRSRIIIVLVQVGAVKISETVRKNERQDER
jgi:hypothetical protein